MTEQQKFCTACGCNVTPQACFCPQCGKPIEGSDAYANMQANQEQFQKLVKESHRNFLVFAIAIYAIPAIVMGLIALLDAGHVADTIFHNADFIRYYTDHHWSFSEGDLHNYLTIIAVMELVSGACAAGTVYLTQKGQKHKVATILCFIAAFLCIWSFVGMFLGLLMAWNVAGSKDIFEN